MNVVISPDINRQGHAGLRRSGERHQLRLAQLRPIAFAGLRRIWPERRKLHEQEREIALPPERAPIADHRREQTTILISAPGVRLTLIPDRALDRVRRKRREHPVIQPRWHPWFAGSARRRLV